uniref:LuxR family transcriptional regulator n=1 Tax=uncultured bacterium 20 TaxID=1748270 RepID=A0A0U3U9Y2_9BACT|nr:LuxR family transcriptional regulator [uncultured bacterium 20]
MPRCIRNDERTRSEADRSHPDETRLSCLRGESFDACDNAGMFVTPLGTKIHTPSPGRAFVPRQRLVSQLESGLGAKLTLVLAPAGFGKTTLVSSWIRSRGDAQSPALPHVAWLSLDENDDESTQFLSYLILALQTVAPHLGEAAKSLLDFPHPVAPEHLVSSIVNDLDDWREPTLLVLDDYHFIRSQAIHDAVAFLIDYAPPHFHVLVASRNEPPLALARWRVRGQLVEIGFQDLRFTREETAEFLNHVMGLDLTADAVGQLEERTEGWVAGLQMAALSLRKSPQSTGGVAHTIAAFGGQHRYVVDYLAEEVMRQQPEHIRDFLRKTSILDRLTAPLCDAVTGRGDSEAILSHLEQSNLFLVGLDEHRQWYRYHPIFADFLRAALPRDERSLLHRQAGEWWVAHRFPTEAIHHALAAEDFETAAALITEHQETELKRGGLSTLLNWLNVLPEAIVLGSSVLSARKGHILYLRGQTEEAQRYAVVAEAALHSDIPPPHRGEVCVFLADLAINRGKASECLELAQEALSLLDDTGSFSRTLALSLAGEAQRLLRDYNGAIHTLRQAVEWGQRSGNHLVGLNALSHLAPLLYFQGRRLEAMILAQQAADGHVDARGHALPVSGLVHVPLGILHYEANDLEQARRHLEIGVALCRQLGMLHLSLTGQRILAKLQFAEGEVDAAFATLSEARGLASRLGNGRAERAIVAVTADLHLRQGNVAAAAGVFDAATSPKSLREHERLTRIRLLLSRGEPLVAQGLLQEMAEAIERDGRVARLITVCVLQALAAHALEAHGEAAAFMERAVRLAAPADYQRLFLDEGALVGTLLRPLRHIAPNFVARLLRVLSSTEAPPEAKPESSPPAPSDHEPLGEREREILRLVAEGLSNEAIGSRLFISVGTVKWYLNGIYHKLDVRNRTEAVARARRSSLL